jgi:hypothetical protein
MAIAIDLGRRNTPAEGGFCTFQPVVDGGNCPWSLNCHSCDKFVLSGADLLYWRRKREQWRLLAEGAPDDATADYLHACFEPQAEWTEEAIQRIATEKLITDVRTMDERLKAARSNIRFQDRRIADLEAQLLEPPAGG